MTADPLLRKFHRAGLLLPSEQPDTRCTVVLYLMRDQTQKDYGFRAAAQFAKSNGIPARAYRECPHCRRPHSETKAEVQSA